MGPTIVVGPDGGEIEFPEGMDDAAINAAMRQIYPPTPAPVAPRAAAPARQPAAAPPPAAPQPAAPPSANAMLAPRMDVSGGPNASMSPRERSLWERFTSTARDQIMTGLTQAAGRFFTRNLKDEVHVDPVTGEQFIMTGLGDQMRRDELERRDVYNMMTQADPWNAEGTSRFQQGLRGLATLAGAFGGGAVEPTNYVGGPGVGLARRIAIDAAVGVGTDVLAQGADIGSGVQQDFDPTRAAVSGGLNAFLPVAAEGAGRVIGAGVNRMLPQAAPAAQQTPGYRVVASEDIPAAEADALVAAGTHQRDPVTGAVYRVLGVEDAPATLDDIEVTATRPERTTVPGEPPFMEAAVAAREGDAPAAAAASEDMDARMARRMSEDAATVAAQKLDDIDAELNAVEGRGDTPSGELLARRNAAQAELSAARAPDAAIAPDDFGPLRPPEAPAPRTLAEDAGAPGRTPDEVLLGPVVRGLDDEFGIPPQPSPAVARAAEADLTLRAPDEPRAPDARAGNLLLNKFDSTLDVATVLEAADTAAGGFAEARRAPQSFAQTEALAEQLGMTADELLKRPNGTAFNAEQSQAARSLLVASAEKVDAIAAKIAERGDPGEDLLNEFRDTVLRHVAIQEQVAGVVAEAGRALGILRNRASSVNITADMLDAMMAGKGPAGMQRAARNIIEAGKKNPRERAKAIEKAYRATGFDVFLEYWYNAILSGPYTHLYNVMSTGANVLNNLPVTATAAAIGAGKKLTGAQWGAERDRVLGSEVYARGVGLLTGAVDGARAFGTTLRTGAVSDNVDRLDTQVRRAIPGPLGSVIRTPSRLLSAEDEFFKATARRMQLNAISLRMAHAEGLRGDAMTARAAELAKNPTEYLSAEADNFARYLTFQTELGAGGRGILRVLDAWPASRIVVPFVRTPINLMKTTVEHSPFAPLLSEWRADVKAGGARADVALAKMAVGMGYGMAIATAAGYGMVTGAAPADKTERGALEASGWKPFSIRVGDQYIDYRRMDPFSSILGIAATLGQPQTPHGKPVDLASAFVSGFLGQLTDKTFLTGLSDFVSAASDETGSKLEAWVKRFGGSFVPAAASQTAQIIDPSKRVTETLADTMQSRIPGMSQDLPAQRDILGDPLRTFSPITPVEDDRAAAAIVSTGARIGQLGKTLQDRKLTGQEYDAYERLAGQYLREGIENWIDTPDWLEMDDAGRRELIEDLADEAREDARKELDLDRPAE